jgi:hypothetical protein
LRNVGGRSHSFASWSANSLVSDLREFSDGTEYSVEAGNLIIFPAGVPHRNWNGGTEPTVHLAVNAPLPDPAKPFARRVDSASG